MLCEHLAALEQEMLENGVVVISRGRPWSKNCREWISVDLVLDTDSLIKRFSLSPVVEVHENTDPRSGLERGLVCSMCHDGIIGAISGAKKYK